MRGKMSSKRGAQNCTWELHHRASSNTKTVNYTVAVQTLMMDFHRLRIWVSTACSYVLNDRNLSPKLSPFQDARQNVIETRSSKLHVRTALSNTNTYVNYTGAAQTLMMDFHRFWYLLLSNNWQSLYWKVQFPHAVVTFEPKFFWWFWVKLWTTKTFNAFNCIL